MTRPFCRVTLWQKSMFSLNENNRIVMARYPCDMRMGVNAMCGRVRAVGLDPAGKMFMSSWARAARS